MESGQILFLENPKQAIGGVFPNENGLEAGLSAFDNLHVGLWNIEDFCEQF